MTAPWWHGATGYQIWPRSFCDSNGDGIGDIPGIVSKLDYLRDLGVGFIWLSPVYRSPQADMGYDIADYRDIAPEYGTLADIDGLIAAAGDRGIRIVMDLVVNHTSDQHPWFQAARSSRDAALRDHYIWRDPAPDGGPPNGMQSVFGGQAWTLDAGTGQYYFHQFAPEQPDLNWDSARMRAAIYEMMNWWLDRGLGGFRMDVIDLIGKDPDRGITANGPRLHDHLREMADATLVGRDVLTVGEAWSVTPQTAPLFRDTLSMVFQFAHVTAGWHPEHGKWRPKDRDWPTIKRVLFDWQDAESGPGGTALFWGNHDLPRAVSTYGSAGRHRVRSAKALATVLHLLRGTPFIYQGEEFGMTNAGFTRIEQYRDLETLNHYALRLADGEDPEAFLAAARGQSRDNARTPVQWTGGPQAGFTTGTPWIEVPATHTTINAVADRAAPDGVFARHQALIDLRQRSEVVRSGATTPYSVDHPCVMAYARGEGPGRIVVIGNLSDDTVPYPVPAALTGSGRPLFEGCGPETLNGTLVMPPWHVVALEMQE